MKWLITGGCGFIGRALIAELQQDPRNKIRVLDNLSVGSRDDLATVTTFADLAPDSDFSNWPETTGLLVGDILDVEMSNLAATGADVIIHLAANTGVGPSVEDPMADCKTNVIGVLNMLEACRSQSVGRFVFASSGAPLGVQTPPLNEEMAPHPASPYGASKLAGEGYCSAYFHSFGVQTVALRFGNVYGEGSGKKSSVVAKFIKQALAGEKLEIYGDGGQTRDFIHISDLIGAIYKASTVKGVGGEVFQIATNAETTVSEMTKSLLVALESEGVARPETFFGPTRTGDVARNYSDTTKAREQLGWTTSVALDDELPQFINILRGDISLVGPRPEDPKIVASHYTEMMMETLEVLPGLTSPGAIFGYAQGEDLLDADDVEGSYVKRVLPTKLALERAYIERRTILLDLGYIALTVLAVLATIFGLRVRPFGKDRVAAQNWGADVPL